MDLVRSHVLKQITLRLSAEGARPVYLAQDRSNGRIFVLGQEAAHALRLLSRAVLSPGAALRDQARQASDDMTARIGIGTLQQLHGARLHEQTSRKPFNPIFAALPLFEVGPYQRHLTGLARITGGWPLAIFIAVLLVLAFVLGTRNDWQIMDAFGSVFSLQAILTFGLIAPVLKIIHELGHVLAATRHGVRVRKAGVYIIGLYPMPFVDCTEADMTARRNQRIAISGAGIVTDIIVGLIAFIAWHLTGGNFLSLLFANIFVFSTLNSVLFNGNPLIKLDGYYVLCDLIGQRNLATRATLGLRGLTRWIGSLGRSGQRPQGGGWALVLYGIGAFAYRINILVVIASALLPAYLGAGAAFVAWGAVVMFTNPLLKAAPPPDPALAAANRWLRPMWWGGGALVLALALAFVRLPVIASVPVTLDSGGLYQISAPTAAMVQDLPVAGMVGAGDRIAALAQPAIEADAADLAMDLALAQQLLASLQGADPARTLIAAEQVDGLGERLTVLRRELANLTIAAPAPGLVVPVGGLQQGGWLAAGAPLATFYPATGNAVMTGPFPEHLIATATGSGLRAGLRLGQRDYLDLAADDLVLREIVRFDRETGNRTWQIFVTLPDRSAAELAGQTGLLRLRYDAVPLWTHASMIWGRLSARFRETQISDMARYLD
jgi:putative peptide zinc metalloprotease protein